MGYLFAQTWIWIAISFVLGLAIGFALAWVSRKKKVEISQERIDLAVEMATKSVDLALVMAGNLPSQQAEADLIKQDIEEIGRRLNEAAEAQGDLAMARLDASIEQFNKTLETVDDASKKAEDPAVKSTLDRIYGVLESVKEQLVGAVLNTQQ